MYWYERVRVRRSKEDQEKTAFLKASVKSATVGFNFDVPVASAIWWSASSLLPAEQILTFSIPERPWMIALTTVLLPSQVPPLSVFHGIDILAHIPHINSCQIPVGFILLIFDLPIGTSRSRTKTKMAFLKWFLDFKNGLPFLRFGGFQKRVAFFFLVFGPYWNEEP